MDRIQAMLSLAAELDDAVAAQDWDRLRLAADALPTQLQGMAARGALSDAERRALARLRAAYQEAGAACGRAARELEMRMDDMHSNKEGRMAYAMMDANPANSER